MSVHHKVPTMDELEKGAALYDDSKNNRKGEKIAMRAVYFKVISPHLSASPPPQIGLILTHILQIITLLATLLVLLMQYGGLSCARPVENTHRAAGVPQYILDYGMGWLSSMTRGQD